MWILRKYHTLPPDGPLEPFYQQPEITAAFSNLLGAEEEMELWQRKEAVMASEQRGCWEAPCLS